MSKNKKNVLNSFLWSSIDIFINQGFVFVIGIFLARFLGPSEFGTIALTSIFISFSMIFIDGGFSKSLIRKDDPSIEDISTIFLFNLMISIVFYILIFFFSTKISIYFSSTELSKI